MDKNKLDHLFERMQGSFDVHETPDGHQSRFMKKLNAQEKGAKTSKTWWKPISIAASVLLLIALGWSNVETEPDSLDLASISPEMEETQSFFTMSINRELETLKEFSDPNSKKLVDDALLQMENLEVEYEDLKVDLAKSGNDKRVIYAMISNFQNRIDLLEQVIETIEEIQNLKTNTDEITI